MQPWLETAHVSRNNLYYLFIYLFSRQLLSSSANIHPPPPPTNSLPLESMVQIGLQVDALTEVPFMPVLKFEIILRGIAANVKNLGIDFRVGARAVEIFLELPGNVSSIEAYTMNSFIGKA